MATESRERCQSIKADEQNLSSTTKHYNRLSQHQSASQLDMQFTKNITYLVVWATVMMTALASALPESVPRAEGESSLQDEQRFMHVNRVCTV